jgi:hypothetical protein
MQFETPIASCLCKKTFDVERKRIGGVGVGIMYLEYLVVISDDCQGEKLRNFIMSKSKSDLSVELESRKGKKYVTYFGFSSPHGRHLLVTVGQRWRRI